MEVNNLTTLPGRGTKFMARVVRRRIKGLKQRISKSEQKKQYLFVVGCQRSGTSMMYKVFEHDPDAGVYDEISVLSSNDKVEQLRFNSYESVLNTMKHNPASLVVAKPLVESQNLVDLLDYFPDSSAIWMFRPYKDVVQSNLRRFGKGNGLTDIQPVIDNDNSNWRAENLDDETREIIKSHTNAQTSEYDAAALFWYARNSLFFKQIEQFNDRVFLCNYDNLVSDPQTTIQRMYEFMQRDFPGSSIQQGININSIGKGKTVPLSDNIKTLCDGMLERLISHQQN